jgi:hypothetical protein
MAHRGPQCIPETWFTLRFDILIQAEQVGRIVLGLDLAQAIPC